MILLMIKKPDSYFVPKHLIKNLEFDAKTKRYFVKSYTYEGTVCLSKCISYVPKEEIFYGQRFIVKILSLLLYRK